MSCTTNSLAGVDVATLQAWLDAARQARHDLMLGQKPEAVAYAQGDGSKSVTYTKADLGQLSVYIAQIEKALGLGRRRASGVRF